MLESFECFGVTLTERQTGTIEGRRKMAMDYLKIIDNTIEKMKEDEK